MKKIITQISALLMAMGIMASAAQAEELSISGDIGVYSQYVWRGIEQTANSTAVQGDVGAAYGGLSASVWFSNTYPSPAPQYAGKDAVEFDWTVDYSGDILDTGLGFSVGGIGYTYLYDSASNFPEVYAGLSYGPVSLTAYYTVSDSANKAYLAGDLWIDLGASASFAGYDFSGTISYANWKNDVVNRPTASLFKDGVNLVTLGVSKDLAVSDVTVTPSLTVTIPVIGKDAAGNRNIYGLTASNEFVAGVNFAY